MPTTTYVSPLVSVSALGSRTDAAGAAVTDWTAEESRLLSTILTRGYVKPTNAFIVAPQSSPNMTVKIGSESAKADYYVVAGTVAGQGNYLVRLDVTSQNVTIDPADASQARTDEIYLVVRDNAYDLSGRVLPQIGYRKGDLGGANPGADAAWRAWELLARVPVAANAIAISAATDMRVAAGISSILTSDVVPKSLLTTKGDLYVASAASTPARVGAGADGQVLTSAPAGASGVQWRGAHLLLSQVLLGSPAGSVSFTSISQAYRHLLLVMRMAGTTASVAAVVASFNDDFSSSYDVQWSEAAGTSFGASRNLGVAGVEVGVVGPAANGMSVSECLIPNYSSSTFGKLTTSRCSFVAATAQLKAWQAAGLWWKTPTAAITKISLYPSGTANFAAGTDLSLYGLG